MKPLIEQINHKITLQCFSTSLGNTKHGALYSLIQFVGVIAQNSFTWGIYALLWNCEATQDYYNAVLIKVIIVGWFIILIIYLLILYAVSPIEKSAIISKLHSYWASNCTLIHPIRSAHVSNLMNHVIAIIIIYSAPKEKSKTFEIFQII